MARAAPATSKPLSGRIANRFGSDVLKPAGAANEGAADCSSLLVAAVVAPELGGVSDNDEEALVTGMEVLIPAGTLPRREIVQRNGNCETLITPAIARGLKYSAGLERWF
ncbi:unnamed protein product [Linum trigynum]|uniref:Uncharacterized protein n=1 Tax=Linum trigynum TaxID=586398 RepID=A0AAV2CWC6_9ROSI